MDGKSHDILEDKISKLKEIIPEAFTEDKVDWEKLRIALGDDLSFNNERYNLNWAGKSEAFKVLQQRTSATLKPVRDESINFDGTENLFIEGENLEVLKVLQKSYFGKIKMIYIDPPYNTGNDSFIYPDKFSESKEEYLKRIGEKDEEGYLLKEGFFRKNSKDSGHYHSNWLSMMYPRLYIARNLLKDDGVIFISIDDNEVHNLRMVMNEIFGEENFIGVIVWKNATDNNPTQIAIEHEYICVYAKDKNLCDSEWKSSVSDVKKVLVDIGNYLNKKYTNEIELQKAYTVWYKEYKPFLWPLDRYKYIDRGGVYIGSQSVHNPGTEGYRYDVLHPKTGKPCKQPLMGYRFPHDSMRALLDDDRILFGEDENKIIELKVYAKDFEEKLSSIIELDGRLGSYDLKGLFTDSVRIFHNPKPVRFLSQFISYILRPDEIMLDFFAGSGSSAQAIIELNKKNDGNRKFIVVQIHERIDENSEAFKAGYKTIADICKERIRRIIHLTPNPSPNGEGDGPNSASKDEKGWNNLFKGASPTLFENAHQMRIEDKTEAEHELWQLLRNRKVENCKFRRQHPIGRFVADFYCHEKKLIVEVDGGYHNEREQREYDRIRTELLEQHDIRVVRFTNEEVMKKPDWVVAEIRKNLTPNPSPNGEGDAASFGSYPNGEGDVPHNPSITIGEGDASLEILNGVENTPLSKWRGAGGEVGFKVFKLSPSSFKHWRSDLIESEEDLNKMVDLFDSQLKPEAERENMLYELMLKMGLMLTEKIEEKERYYSVAEGKLAVVLKEVNQNIIDEILKAKPQSCIMLDDLFAGNDQLKTNTALQMKDAGVELVVV